MARNKTHLKWRFKSIKHTPKTVIYVYYKNSGWLIYLILFYGFRETAGTLIHYPIQDVPFSNCSRIAGGGSKRSPFPKICQTYPTMTKHGAPTLYLKKIRKIYNSRDTPLEFC